MDVLQSAYRAKHSTETALLKVVNDILSSLDEEGNVVILVLLDLLTAFDMIDHALLLSSLLDMYRIHNRLQQVTIKGMLLNKQ